MARSDASYFEVMKEYSDGGFIKANSSKIDVGTKGTVFGTVDQRWYGYKTTSTMETQLCVLFSATTNARTCGPS